MVSPYHAITAGHNLRLPLTSMLKYGITSNRPVSVKFSLAKNGEEEPFPTEVEDFIVHEKWFSDESPDFDYAAIRLNTPLGKLHGHGSLRALTDEDLLRETVTITGYPVIRTLRHPKMFTMSGSISHTSSHRLFYTVDTSGGQSGSGIWGQEKDNVLCFGVHTNGFREEKGFNSGVRVTEDVIHQFEKWVTFMGDSSSEDSEKRH